jgi:hypothetical protein
MDVEETHPTDETPPDFIERIRRLSGWVVTPPSSPGHDGPPCIWCNAETRRAGAYWVCPMCEASTFC